jgi:Putative adhesin
MEALAAPAPPRRSVGRVVLIVLGSIVTAGVIGIVAFLLLDFAARHSFQTSTAFTSVRTLTVHSGAGDVTLKTAPAGSALVVKAHETEGLFKPRLRSRLAAGGALSLTASCPGQLECSVYYDLAVPPDVAIKVSSGFGDISATGLTSASSIQLGTTAGDLHASGLAAPSVKLSTGVGGLTASLAQPARILTASTVAGGMTLTVPDTTYVVHANSGVGHVSDSAVQVAATSPRTIDATSSLGNITITPR